jgi:glycosyltransferase involved in cell wall biosynthesis
MAGRTARGTRRGASAPIVTIGMPVWNGERFVGGGIESLLGQTFGPLELVISDNGSSDGTQAICEGYARRDPRVRYQRLDHNIGLQANFARLIDEATGPYFMWAGHDDRWDPTYIERMVGVLDARSSLVLAGSNAASIDQHDVERWRFNNVDVYGHARGTPARLRRFMAEPPGGGHATMLYGLMRTSVIRNIGFDAPGPIRDLNRGYYAMDLLTLFRLILEGEFHVDEATLYRRRDVVWTADQWAAHYARRRDTKRYANAIQAAVSAHGYYADLRSIVRGSRLSARHQQSLVRATYREELRFHPGFVGHLAGGSRRRLRRLAGETQA